MTTVGTSKESSNRISRDEFLISMENFKVDETTKKTQMERVPSLVRRNNSYENCYDPFVVSIGPYHHGKRELVSFQDLKFPIARKFWRSYFSHVSIRELFEEVEKVGRSARECYEGGSTEGYDDEAFNVMMFLDACFILHNIFRLRSVPSVADGELKELNAKLYKYQIPVLRDLFLLENQIPFLVLKALMNFKFEKIEDQKKLIWGFLKKITIMPSHGNSRTNADKELDFDGSPHLLHLMWEQLTMPNMHADKKFNTLDSSKSDRSVTELKSAGIHFKPSQTGNVTDIEFKSHFTFGILTLPKIRVDDSAKPLLLNLVAYEMCPHGPSETHIASYICLIDSLIDHADDVKELRKKEIIFNDLSSDQHLAEFFNEVANNLAYDHIYGCTLREIDNHCKKKRHVWIAEWMNKYFNSPWALLAFLGAILALALASVQTFFTVFPRK